MYKKELCTGMTGAHKMPVTSSKILAFRVFGVVPIIATIIDTRGCGGSSMYSFDNSLDVDW